MSKYSPMVQQMSELNRDEFKRYTISSKAFEHGNKLLFEEFQPALKLATNEVDKECKGQFFKGWRPIIPAASLIIQYRDDAVPTGAHQLTVQEKESLGVPTPVDVHFGEPNPDTVLSVSAFFSSDVLHDQYAIPAGKQNGQEFNLAIIAKTAEKRMAALDLLTNAIYRMPAETRETFAQEMTQQLCRFSGTNQLDSLRMVLGTEPLDARAGLPTTELFASMVGTSAKSLKGFAQDSPIGLDFGMRLLQRVDKQLSWELRADTISQMHDMHYMYGQALSQSANRDPLSCTNALASAMLQWSWKLSHDIDAIVENIDTLGALSDEIQREMDRPADKAFSALIQAVPAAEQCEFRAHLLTCPQVAVEGLLFSTDMREVQVGVTLACDYAAKETDVSDETKAALHAVISEQFIQSPLESMKAEHGDDILGIFGDSRFDDMLNALYDIAEGSDGIPDELSDAHNEEVIDG